MAIIMAIIMTLWIVNGAVLQSSSQWQLNEFRKFNYSGHELFIFKILLTLYHTIPTFNGPDKETF